jgi:hypothetical protein
MLSNERLIVINFIAAPWPRLAPRVVAASSASSGGFVSKQMARKMKDGQVPQVNQPPAEGCGDRCMDGQA